MTDLIETRLNSRIFSATSCSWKIAFAPYVGVTALSYEDKRERALVHASRKDGTPLGMTEGKYTVPSVSITMLRSSGQRLMEQLSILGLGSYGDAIFPILATYSEPLAPVPPIVVAISGCRISGVKEDYAEGIDALVTVFDIQAMDITRNGLSLYSRINGLGL